MARPTRSRRTCQPAVTRGEAATETHVVTISLEFADGQVPSAFSCELWRGTETECRELAGMIPGCEHDHRQISGAQVSCGTIADWESWVRGAMLLRHL